MYGSFSMPMQSALQPFIAGKSLVDLGYGDGGRAIILHALGAKPILAIDSNGRMRHTPAIEYLDASFEDAIYRVRKMRPDVAHVAWPSNHGDGSLRRILKEIPCVAYVGCNTDAVACGTPDLFDHFVHRPVLTTVRERQNTLIVYGPVTPCRRSTIEIEVLLIT